MTPLYPEYEGEVAPHSGAADPDSQECAISKTGAIGRPPAAPEQAPVTRHTAGGSGATYRATPADDWRECEIVARHPHGFVLREIGRPLPGVWLASSAQVRVIVGTLEAPEIVPRNYLPKDATQQQLYHYRHVREVAGREEALRQVFGP